jgi:hypothetical protein
MAGRSTMSVVVLALFAVVVTAAWQIAKRRSYPR